MSRELPPLRSVHNDRVKAWRRLLSRTGRAEAGRFLIEGAHLVEEALIHRPELVETVLVLEDNPLPPPVAAGDAPVCRVSEAVLGALSEAKSPQGVVAVCLLEPPPAPAPAAGRFLLLDGVRDPGNLGTLIRTADAAGLDAVVVGSGSADVYNPKTLRATQGSVFHLPVVEGDLAAWIAGLRAAGVPVLGSGAHEGLPYTKYVHGGPFALLVGNESRGTDADLLARCDAVLTIPLRGPAESLSVAVATGVLLFYLTQN